MFGIIAIIAALAVSPARADDPAGQLCAMTGCPGIDFGRPRGRPESEPRYEEKRCPECEADALRRLNESIASMEHPKPVVPLSEDMRSILDEDVVAANASLAMTSLGLERILVLHAPVRAALLAAAALTALNTVLRPQLTGLVDNVIVPVWLNMISFAQAASAAAKSCSDLSAAALGACANVPAASCAENDDCRTLLAKRAPLLDCDRAASDLRNGDCPDPPATDQKKMDQNLADVKICGRLISGNPRCCPEHIRATKDTACPDTPGGCMRENRLALNGIFGRPPGVTQTDCQAARVKRDAAEACGAAREAESTQCYEGRLDAGHQKILNDVLRNARGCGAFLEGAQRFGLCP